jgi:hypothetical protein
MSCIGRVLSLLGYRRRIQHWQSAVLRIDVLAGDAALLLFPGTALVNGTDADARSRCHLEEYTRVSVESSGGLQAAGP